jgi:hypothetical protein
LNSRTIAYVFDINFSGVFTGSFELALLLFLKDYYENFKDFNMKLKEHSRTKSIFLTFKEFSKTTLICKEFSRPVGTLNTWKLRKKRGPCEIYIVTEGQRSTRHEAVQLHCSLVSTTCKYTQPLTMRHILPVNIHNHTQSDMQKAYVHIVFTKQY